VSFPEADLDVNAYIVGLTGFSIQFDTCRFVGGINAMISGNDGHLNAVPIVQLSATSVINEHRGFERRALESPRPIEIDGCRCLFHRRHWLISDFSKDDIPDSCALNFQCWGPRAEYEKEDPEESEARRQEEEEESARERRRLHYNRMFGHDYVPPPPMVEEPQQPIRPQDPRLRLFGNKGPWRL
jgi:hypothetical protein